MNRVEFFNGIKLEKNFSITLNGGNTVLDITILGFWEQILACYLVCGDERSRKLTRRVGISTREKNDLEGTITGSLGIKGFASLESQIRSSSGFEIQFDRTEELEDKFTFTAPKCGSKNVFLFQYKSIIEINYLDNRWLKKNKGTIKAEYWFDKIYDGSYAEFEIPECGCKSNSPYNDNKTVIINIGKISMLADYYIEGKYIVIPELGQRIESSENHLNGFKLLIRRENIPSYLLFLAGENEEILSAEFSLQEETKNYSFVQVAPRPLLDTLTEDLSNLNVVDAAKLVTELKRIWGVELPRPLESPSGHQQLSAKEPEEEKTEFDVIIKDAGVKKTELIKVVRKLTALGLKEAKELTDSSGSTVLSSVSKEVAEDAKNKLRDAGANVELKPKL